MSQESLTANIHADCVYKGIFEQAKSTIFNLGNALERYSENRYQQSMKNLNTTWQNFRFQQLNHPFAKEMSSTEHRLAMERELKEASSEIVFKKMMERAFVTIKMLNDTYEEVKSYFDKNAERIKHDIGNENFEKVQTFLNQCHSYLKYDFDELKRVLMALNIAEPPSDSIQTSNFHLEPRLEWQLVRDHLVIMEFLEPMYNILIESCQAKMQ